MSDDVEELRPLGYREMAMWYRQLSQEDQLEITKAVNKQRLEKLVIKPKGKKDGAPIHDNRNK